MAHFVGLHTASCWPLQAFCAEPWFLCLGPTDQVHLPAGPVAAAGSLTPPSPMQPASPGTIGGPPGLRGVVRAVNKTTAVPGPKYWGKPAHMLTTAAYRREHGNIQRRTIPVQHPVHTDRAEAPERCA